MDGMTRGEVAEKAGVNPETLRYYERKELIPKPRRSDGGFRLYDESYVDRLRFIRRAKQLGFTLAEIKELLELRVGEEATCQDVKARTTEKLEEVEAKIQDLKPWSSTVNGSSLDEQLSLMTSKEPLPTASRVPSAEVLALLHSPIERDSLVAAVVLSPIAVA